MRSDMRKMVFCLCAALMLAVGAVAEVPVVTNVVAVQQGSNKLVNITYDVFDADGDPLKIRVEISSDGGTNYSVPAFTFTGDIGDNVTTGANKLIVWDAGADWDGEYSDQMKAKIIASDTKGLPGLAWGNEVPAGGFLMGQDGGAEGSGQSRHVNIPWSYWLSKYEITAKEYCDYLNIALVAGEVWRDGTASVKANSGVYTGVPLDSVLVNIGDIRDVRWNVNNFEVCEDRTNFPVRTTWYGAVAFAQHYGYDLPTEAEWEKAARGPDHEDEDTHWTYPWGDAVSNQYANSYSSVDPWDGDTTYRATTPVGYYDGNQTPIGPDMANAYGLYDMSGNVCEWTRTAWASSVETYPQEESLTNLVNNLTNGVVYRVLKGGGWRTQDWTYDNDDSRGGHLPCWARLYRWQIYDYGYLPSQPDLGFRVIRRQ